MNPNIAANQQRLFLDMLAQLRPHFGRDSALPRRITDLLNRNRALGSRDRKLYRELIYTTLRFLPWVDELLGSETDCRTAASRHAASPSPDGAAPHLRQGYGGHASAGPTGPELAAKIVAWLAPELKPTSLYRAAHSSDWPAVPETLAGKAAVLESMHARYPLLTTRYSPEALLPAWFREHCPAAFTEPHLSALNRRASIWVRLQVSDRKLVLDEFAAQHWPAESPADFPDAVCLPPNADVAGTDAYRRGFIEIQDLGSQLVLAHAAVAPGSRWLDACAGAGGKTLQLARLVGDSGHVDATDLRADVLEELADRAARARLTNIAIGQPTAGLYDGVLVDAPCSGSGTWRRQPHLKWYLKPETIPSFNQTQLAILTANAPLVKPDGQLVYATCSLSHHENHDLVAKFLATHPEFAAEKPKHDHGGDYDGLGTTLLPGTRNTDGFYVAVLRRA
ncbi:MAG: RsmB/NOP family class I SAM-dependent RNA methyltransferase [Opitutae bacterium]|nr:RsmB/NOP family class I SAM-dependent RNA methyltransferase [Opitutae bacterium]